MGERGLIPILLGALVVALGLTIAVILGQPATATGSFGVEPWWYSVLRLATLAAWLFLLFMLLISLVVGLIAFFQPKGPTGG